jgi:hypothetical protein
MHNGDFLSVKLEDRYVTNLNWVFVVPQKEQITSGKSRLHTPAKR